MKRLLCLVVALWAVEGHCGTGVDEFRGLVDNRVAVRTSLGVRYARPLSADKVELAIGMSVTKTAENPVAYRVISEADPNYAFEKFVKPVKAEVKKELDCRGVAGSPFSVYERTVVSLQLPFPMKDGVEYSVVAQGVGGEMVTGAHSAEGFTYHAGVVPSAPDNSVDLAVLGLRQVLPVGNGVIKLEFGPNISVAAASRPDSYQVSLNGKPVQVVNLGRITKIDTYLPTGWPFVAIPMHEVFLQMAETYQDGDAISVEVAQSLTTAANSAAVAFKDMGTFSDSIKVNQIGYLADSPVKIAYLGRWMGSFPELKAAAVGADGGEGGGLGVENDFWNNLKTLKSQTDEVDGGKKDDEAPPEKKAAAVDAPTMGPGLAFDKAPTFSIVPEKGGAPVFTGQAKLIHRSGTLDEGVSAVDHSGENVYVLDFTDFKIPGRYVVSVPGVGRSVGFAIGDDVYARAFEVQAYGVFAQRCGIELKPPFSDWRRIACHKKGLILTSQMKNDPHDISTLPEKTIYEKTGATANGAASALDKDPALVARYAFDGDFKDASGHGLDLAPVSRGTLFSDSDPKTFPAGKCYGPTADAVKNGAQGMIDFDVSGGVTVAFWFKKVNRQKFNGFFSLGAVPGNRFFLGASWGVPILQAGKGGASLPALKMGRPADNTWHHLTATLDPVDKRPRLMALYDNGVSMGSETLGELDGTISGPLLVGCLEGDEAGGAMLEDFRIYARTLSQKEIADLATPHPTERPIVIQAYGGHHDAGDYNPRSHYDVAQKLMNAYEMAPQKFYDGQLNIPEKGNGVPDILDEAFWALRLWIDMQDEDGGVHNGTESNGDPNFIQTVELDPKGDYAYAKDAEGSFLFAGLMAQASRLWRANGKVAEADRFLAKAVKAYAWGMANPLKATDTKFYGYHVAPPKAYAAAQLLHATKDPKYNEDFLASCVWTRKPDAELDIYGQYDMQEAAWAYAACPTEIVDAKVQAAIKTAIVKKADLFIQLCSTMSYAFIRHPWAPINWGTGAYENFVTPVVQAYVMTGDRKYLCWIVRTCDNTLGANPLCRSYIVGAGERTVRAPLHNSRYGVTGEVVDGQQVEGPVQAGDGYRIQEVAYPKIKVNFASLYTFVDNHFAIGMDEGVSPAQAQSMAVFGLMLPDRK